MNKRKIIIDCDPGQDDAVMLLLALACPDEFDILGITTVAGNVPLDLTQRNARIMCELAGRSDVPVFAGCDKPMRHELITAENVHGKRRKIKTLRLFAFLSKIHMCRTSAR